MSFPWLLKVPPAEWLKVTGMSSLGSEGWNSKIKVLAGSCSLRTFLERILLCLLQLLVAQDVPGL